MSESRVPMRGGVSSDVVIVKSDDGSEIVVKQALPKLKVAADWFSDPSRFAVEVQGLRAIRELLGPGVVPEVLWVDEKSHSFAMERIDPNLGNWRDQLNEGLVDVRTAGRAGELLAQMHSRSAARPELAARFARREFFEQLRIEPFFVRCAERNLQAAPAIKRIISILRAPGASLVHGDYSPKNMLASASRLVILDCEVCHWGDPRFDIAFCLSHLLLDGSRFSSDATAFRNVASAFLERYVDERPLPSADSDLSALIGCLVLARIDGDSPVDFLDRLDIKAVKQASLDLVMAPPATALEAIHQILPLNFQ